MKYLTLLLILSWCVPTNIWACSLAESAYPRKLDKFIDVSSDIYIARLIKGETNGAVYDYTFEVLKVIKGSDNHELNIKVDSSILSKTSNLGKHDGIKFWIDPKVGGNKVDSDCNIRPNFNLGYKYLLIFSEENTVKNFEIVNDHRDRWLTFVKSVIDGKATPIYSSSELLSKIESVDLYSCRQERDKLNLREQLYVDNIFGRTAKPIWPSNLGRLCMSGNQQYMQITFKNNEFTMHLPYDVKHRLNFDFISPTLLLTNSNTLILPLKE